MSQLQTNITNLQAILNSVNNLSTSSSFQIETSTITLFDNVSIVKASIFNPETQSITFESFPENTIVNNVLVGSIVILETSEVGISLDGGISSSGSPYYLEIKNSNNITVTAVDEPTDF